MLGVRTLDRKFADLDGRMQAEVEASGTTLTEIFGIGSILAARIIGTVGNVALLPEQNALRPLRWSGAGGGLESGEEVRHKLSLALQPQAQQSVLHMVATCKARSDSRGGVYYRKKITEGKSQKEALWSLKRRVSDAVFIKSDSAPGRLRIRHEAPKEEPRTLLLRASRVSGSKELAKRRTEAELKRFAEILILCEGSSQPSAIGKNDKQTS